MAKAQAKLKYDPANVDFWRDHWALRQLVETLKARTDLKPGDNVRVIVVPDTEDSTLFLTGSEVNLVIELLENYLENWDPSSFEHGNKATAENILNRLPGWLVDE